MALRNLFLEISKFRDKESRQEGIVFTLEVAGETEQDKYTSSNGETCTRSQADYKLECERAGASCRASTKAQVVAHELYCAIICLLNSEGINHGGTLTSSST